MTIGQVVVQRSFRLKWWQFLYPGELWPNMNGLAEWRVAKVFMGPCFVRLCQCNLQERCLYLIPRERMFCAITIKTLRTKFYCGWWNNSNVSGTRMSHLARPSSHLLVRWEPWSRRMFRCQNDVEKYVRDVCLVHRHKSTRTVWDLLMHVMLPFSP